MKRLFIAVKILPCKEFLNAYSILKKELAYEKIKWVDANNLHFTLKFIGNTESSRTEKIITTLKEIAINTKDLKITINGLGIFGSRYDPRVIWAGIESNKQLLELGENVLNDLDVAGFERGRQNFVPHITLGRIKHIRDKKHLKQVVDNNRALLYQEDWIKSFHLFESILKPEGPQYKVVKTFNLQS